MSELQNILVVHKEVGETPLEALENARVREGISADVPMTYAGRLDPMAEGVLLVLVGEECKNKEEYLGLDKEYEVEVLFGFATDTGDVLGKVTTVVDTREGENEKSQVRAVVNTWEGKSISQNSEFLNTKMQKFVGKFIQEYPAYSSKTVDGVQLHELANRGTLPEEMPTKEVEIYNIEMLGEREIQAEVLLEEINNNIAKVKGDFRQAEILDLWNKELENNSEKFTILKIRVGCSSGTYMRALAENIGKSVGVSALAYSIKRTRVGEYCKLSKS